MPASPESRKIFSDNNCTVFHSEIVQSIRDHLLFSFYDDEDYIQIYNQISNSGAYNFERCNTVPKKDSEDFNEKILMKEKQYGAILGPFTSNPFDEKVIISPLNTVPKKDSEDFNEKILMKEKQYGAILGPFTSNPFDEKVIISPLNTVPKKDSEDRRVVLDLSFPKGDSVNDHVSKDFFILEKESI